MNRTQTPKPSPETNPSGLSFQYDSFKRFFSLEYPNYEFSLQRLIEKHGVIDLDGGQHKLFIKNWHFNTPDTKPEDCIFSNCTYSGKLWFTFSLKGPWTGQAGLEFSKNMAFIPMPTKDSEFILSSKQDRKANRYTMTMQLALSPGVYYKEKRGGEVRTCTIIPAVGKKMILRAIKNKADLKMGSLKLSLQDFEKILSDEKFDDHDIIMLRSLYGYLSNRDLLPKDRKFRLLSDADIDKIAFCREIFQGHLGSFDMSYLGRKQMESLGILFGLESSSENTFLSLEPLKDIIKKFKQRKLLEIDDRSLKYRKVKLIGDFLFELIEQAMIWFKKHVLAQWQFIASEISSPGKESPKPVLVQDNLNALIPYGPFQHWFKSLLRDNPLVQLLDTTNPLAEISQKRRLTFRGPGGIPEKVLFLDKRDVHCTDFGRLCPVETPQGEHLGFNLYLAIDARINSQGLIEAEYIDLTSNEKVFLDPYDEAHQVKAAISIEQHSEDKMVYARTPQQEMTLVNKDEITHISLHPCSFLGYSASLVPFIQHNDANRALMGANMMKQALPLLKPEPPLIMTGFETRIARQYNSPSPFMQNGNLCLGKNLLTGYMPWDLLNYEDGIVISDRLVQDQQLTHVTVEEFIIDEVFSIREGRFEEITLDNPNIEASELQKLDELGVIKENQEIGLGTPLVSKLRSLRPEERNMDQHNPVTHLIMYIFGHPGEEMKDASFYTPEKINGTVMNVAWVQDRLPSGVKRRVRILVETRRHIQVGDKLAGRHGNKGVVSCILSEREMPYFKSEHKKCSDDACKVLDGHTHLEILLNPLTITGRMNLGQLYETALSNIFSLQKGRNGFMVPPFDTEWNWDRISSELKYNSLSDKKRLYIHEDGKETELKHPVTVGYQYFLKLRQLAENKLKARSRFAYNPTTGQPAVPAGGDKWERAWTSRRTAQRLGEMEVWALEGHSARNILDELLFLKSDDENLRQQLVEYFQGIKIRRKKAFREVREKATEKKWQVEDEGTCLKVICMSSEEEAELKKTARKLALKTEEKAQRTFLLHFAPIDLSQREHRAFKAFVHYCRVLGLEIEGRDEKDQGAALVGIKASPWPKITGISIRIASDEERRQLTGGNSITGSGTGDKGLWSNAIFGDVNAREDKTFRNEATAIIELAVPVDNPLFRPIIELLLDRKGYLLDAIKYKLQELITELYQEFEPDWIDFWKEAYDHRSCLQTVDDLIDWIESIQLTNPSPYSREKIAAAIGEKLSTLYQFNFMEVLNPESPYYMNSQKLFHHFEVMDLKRLRENFQAINKPKARQQRQLELVETLISNKYDPKLFFIKNLIVPPKNLRFERNPVSSHDNPRYENDLNTLYQWIVNQNQRVKNVYQNSPPRLICTNEEEKLRKLVYGLLVNDKIGGILEEPLCRRGSVKPLRSVLSCIIGQESGKEGIFRQHLLGKRVDFSGRGVIVPDPELGIDEAGLPYSVGKTLYHDFLINRLLKEIPDKEWILDDKGETTKRFRKISIAMRRAKAKAKLEDENGNQKISRWLDDLSKDYPVLLNRAPSLHRLSMLAFYPRFHEKKNVLALNPYVCAPFNADFDGDTMAVHLPALPASREEAMKMLPSKILRSPAHGEIVINHKGDLALAWHLVRGDEDALGAANNGLGKISENEDLYSLFEKWHRDPEKFRKNLSALTAILRNVLKKSGFSLGIGDFVLVKDIRSEVARFEEEFESSKPFFISSDEQIRFWDDKTQKIKEKLKEGIREYTSNSPISILMESKAATIELNQLSGMRGIMLRPGGMYVPYPVLSNIVNGLTPLEYFVSCHGSRHGLCDKGLMTGPAGDLTNILVQAAQAEYIVEEDCKVDNGLWFSAFDDPQSNPISLKDRVKGRFLAAGVNLNEEGKIESGTEVTEELAEKIWREKIKWIKLRSPITCKAVNQKSRQWQIFVEQMQGKKIADALELPSNEEGILNEEYLLNVARSGRALLKIFDKNGTEIKTVFIPPVKGICQKCYGLDLATGKLPPIGYPAGIIAAQSIGEPGTQLTLRTFHTGGIAGQETTQGLVTARKIFSTGLIEEPMKSSLSGTAVLFRSPNGLYWLEITGCTAKGEQRSQRIPVFALDPVSGWTEDMEKLLVDVEELSYQESTNDSGSRVYSFSDIEDKAMTIKTGESFFVSRGQRVYFTKKRLEFQSVSSIKMCEKYGPLAASEYLTHLLQKIYNHKSRVADHHFEVMLRTMMHFLVFAQPFREYKKGDMLSLHDYFSFSDKPVVSMRSVLNTGLHNPGFLGRIGFRRATENLMCSSLRKETDWLKGLKEKIMTGNIRAENQ